MEYHYNAEVVIDALADAGYISDHKATTPEIFQEMVKVAAKALRERQRQIDLDTPD